MRKEGGTMPLKTIQTMLATAPASANWWSTNKESITKTWKLWGRWSNVLGACSFVALMISGVLNIASLSGIVDDQYMGAILFCGSVLFVFGAVWSEARKLKILANQYKQGVNEFGFDPNVFRKEFSEDMRKNLVSNLRNIGVEPQQIVALRHLELPNSWWHLLNAEVNQHLKTTETPTLDQVYIEVERDIVSPEHSKFLRL